MLITLHTFKIGVLIIIQIFLFHSNDNDDKEDNLLIQSNQSSNFKDQSTKRTHFKISIKKYSNKKILYIEPFFKAL